MFCLLLKLYPSQDVTELPIFAFLSDFRRIGQKLCIREYEKKQRKINYLPWASMFGMGIARMSSEEILMKQIS